MCDRPAAPSAIAMDFSSSSPPPRLRLAALNLSSTHSPYAALPYSARIPQGGRAGPGFSRDSGISTARARAVRYSATPPPAQRRPGSAAQLNPRLQLTDAQQPSQTATSASLRPATAHSQGRPRTARDQQPSFQLAQYLSPQPPSPQIKPASAAPTQRPATAFSASPPPAGRSKALYELHRPRRRHHVTSDFAAERASKGASGVATNHELLSPASTPHHSHQSATVQHQVPAQPHAPTVSLAPGIDHFSVPAQPLSPTTAEELLGIGGTKTPRSHAAKKHPPRAVLPAPTADDPLAAWTTPAPSRVPPVVPPSPPESVWCPPSASATPLVDLVSEQLSPSTGGGDGASAAIAFRVDWSRELMLATGPLMMSNSPAPDDAQQSPEADDARVQNAAAAPSQLQSSVPLFVLQRRERERQEQEAQEMAAAASDPAACPTSRPPVVCEFMEAAAPRPHR